MEPCIISDNENDSNIIIKVFVNNKFYVDDIVFDLVDEYNWSNEIKKYITEIKINSLKKRGSSLVKYFAKFSKQQSM